MPSPGRTAIFMPALYSGRAVGQPRLACQALGLEGADLVGMAQREADVVEAVDEAVLAKRLHVEGDLAAIGLDDHLPRQVDRELVADEAGHLVEIGRASGRERVEHTV